MPVNSKDQPSIYQIATEKPGETLAGWLRTTIAKLAVANPGWCTAYNKMLATAPDGILRHSETSQARHDSNRMHEMAMLTDLVMTPQDAASTLREQAYLLGGPGATDVSDVDLVAGVIGAEVWMAALNYSNLAYATAAGPDAVGSAAAILARVCGQGIPIMPVDPDWPTLRFPMEGVILAIRHGRTWVNRTLGKDAWENVCAKIITDLGFCAGGGTKTHEASLLLGVRAFDIEPWEN